MALKNIIDRLAKRPLITIALFSIVMRAIVYILYQNIAIYPDSEGYQFLAKALNNLSLNGYNGQRSPGYPVLIDIAAQNVIITVILQTIIGIATAFYTYKTMLLLNFKSVTSVITATLLNCLLIVIFYEASILTETLILFFVTLVFYELFNGFFNCPQTTPKLLWFSFILGYLILIKPFYIFMPFVIYGLYTLKDFNIKKIINKKIIILFFPLISFLGWSYINKLNTGHFVSTTFYGINIAQNCVYFAEKAPPEYKIISDIYVKHREEAIKKNESVTMVIWQAYDDLESATGLGFTDLSAELAAFSSATIAKNPVDYIKQVSLSWYNFWRTSLDLGYLEFKNSNNRKILSVIWLPQRLLLRGFKILFVILIPFHTIAFIRKKKITPQFIITVIVFCTSILQAMATYGTNARFSFPFEFIMVISVMLTLKEPVSKLVAGYMPRNVVV